MSYKITPGGYRLPFMNSPEAIDNADFMDEETKEFAKMNLTKIPATQGWTALGCNPDMQAFWQMFERELTSLFEGDMQGVPFGFMFIGNFMAAKEAGLEYVTGVISASAASSVHDYGLGYDGVVKLQMMDYPDAECWSEEERLCLKFSRAVVRMEMTDELMQAAIDAWGEKSIILRMSWLAYTYSMMMFQSAMNLKWDFNVERFPYGSWTPEGVQAVLNNLDGSYLQIRECWENMATFAGDPMVDD